MDVIGIDLAGPCNAADTAVAAFRANGHSLVLRERLVGADDATIASAIGHIWQGRDDRYSALRASIGPDTGSPVRRVEMSYIGG